MSSLKYMHMNQSWPEQFAYYCFGTKRVNLLSKHQLVSRLYKTFLHRINELNFMELQEDPYHCYVDQIRIARTDFETLLTLERGSP